MKKEKKYKEDPLECAHVTVDEEVVEILSNWSITDPTDVPEDPKIDTTAQEHRTILCPDCGSTITQQRRVDGDG